MTTTPTINSPKSLEQVQLEQAHASERRDELETIEIPFDGIQEAYTAERLSAMQRALRARGKDNFPIRTTMTTAEVISLRRALKQVYNTTQDDNLKIAIARYFRRNADQLRWLDKF